MYADKVYYKQNFKGTVIPSDALLDQFLESASFDVDHLTRHRTSNLASLTPFQLDQVKRANCHQAEHLYMQNDPSGLTVTSLSKKGSSITYANGNSRFSRFAIDRLMSSGLMYAGL